LKTDSTDYAPRIEVRALYIQESVSLPAATKDGNDIWWRGEPTPRPPKHPGFVMIGGILVRFDEANPEHVAARAAEKATRPSVSRHQPAPQDAPKYGERMQPDGMRTIKLPPVEWPPKPEPKVEKTSDGRKRLPEAAPN
jgi:hypothetical protein